MLITNDLASVLSVETDRQMTEKQGVLSVYTHLSAHIKFCSL